VLGLNDTQTARVVLLLETLLSMLSREARGRVGSFSILFQYEPLWLTARCFRASTTRTNRKWGTQRVNRVVESLEGEISWANHIC